MIFVDKLKETTGQAIAYDIDQPFAAPSNQEAIANLTRALGLEHQQEPHRVEE